MGDSRVNKELMFNCLTPKMGCTLIFNNRIQIYTRVEMSPDIEQYDHNAGFNFTLFAPDPYWLSVQQIKVSITGLVPMFKFPVNYSKPHQFGKRIRNQFINVINDGNVKAPFDLTFIAKTQA